MNCPRRRAPALTSGSSSVARTRGCGLDYWLRHKPTGKEAYVNDDQGHVKVDCELAPVSQN